MKEAIGLGLMLSIALFAFQQKYMVVKNSHRMELDAASMLAVTMIIEHRTKQRFMIPRDTTRIVHGVDFRAVA